MDRLSNLPDAIIHEILCFLDLKQAIKTSILSKRWRYLWASLPDLNFIGSFQDVCQYSDFDNFVREVLSSRNDCNVRKVKLFSAGPLNQPILDLVVNYSVSHHVVELIIESFYRTGPLSFPPSLSMCKSLGTLRLFNLNLWCSEDHFGSCSYVKNLRIRCCSLSGSKVLKIHGLQLVNIDLDLRVLEDGYRIEIVAPNLSSFSYTFSPLVDFSGLQLPSLNCVDIVYSVYELQPFCKMLSPDENRKVNLRVINLLKGLGNAQHVNLNYEVIKMLYLVPGLLEQQPSPFRRLKSWTLHYHIENGTYIPANVQTFLGWK